MSKGLPALLVLNVVGLWVKQTGKPMPKDPEGWIRAAKMYVNIASKLN